jgi:hypothetical protein
MTRGRLRDSSAAPPRTPDRAAAARGSLGGGCPGRLPASLKSQEGQAARGAAHAGACPLVHFHRRQPEPRPAKDSDPLGAAPARGPESGPKVWTALGRGWGEGANRIGGADLQQSAARARADSSGQLCWHQSTHQSAIQSAHAGQDSDRVSGTQTHQEWNASVTMPESWTLPSLSSQM